MRALHIPRESVENLSVTVRSDEDPTAFPVEFAFTQNEDRPTSWLAGTWDDGESFSGGKWTAVARTPLVGTSPADLTPGNWILWCHLDGSPEDPVLRAGDIVIT